MTTWYKERTRVLKTAIEMSRRGLVVGTSGNVSMRLGHPQDEILAITPSGKDYNQLSPEDIVVINFAGDPLLGDLIPSTETLTHVSIYRARADVRSVIHTHSVYASVAAVAGLEIPPIVDEMVIAVGGAIEIAKYAFPSTEELGHYVVASLGDRKAVLLRNHGLVGVGTTTIEALSICELVERVAKIFIIAQLTGGGTQLPEEIVQAERELYKMRIATDLTTTGDV